MSDHQNSVDSQAAQEFMQSFVKSQKLLLGFVQTLLPSLHDAEEVLQETSIILWKKWPQYDRNRDFVNWACGIARYEVFRFLRKKKRPLHLSEAVLNQIADMASAQASLDSDDRECMDALEQCVSILKQKDRELLTMRYRKDTPVAEISTKIGLAPSTIFESLQKIRTRLLRCVQLRLEQTEGLRP